MTLSITSPTGVVYTDTTTFFYQPSCSSLSYLSASVQPSVTGCAATGIEYINRPNPTLTSFTTSTVTTSVVLGLPPRTVTSTTTFLTTVTRTLQPNDYSPPTASPYSTRNFAGVVRDLTFGTLTSPATIYGRGPYNLVEVVNFFRGYFLPNVTGQHTFTIGQPDDVGYMWIGSEAINGFTAANSDINNAVVAGLSVSTNQTLTQGQPVPIRIAFGNYGGAYSYQISVKDPNGLVKTNTWGMFLQPFCGTVPYSQWT